MSLYTYKFLATRVVDGDTVDGRVDLGFRIWMDVRVRLIGYDAPETWRPKSDDEAQAGERVKDFLEYMIQGEELIIKSRKLDLYNRASGELFIGDESVNEAVMNFIRRNELEKERFR